MNTDRLVAALRALVDEDRALIELSEVRSVPIAEIAVLLGVPEGEVAVRRRVAFDRFAAAAGAESAAERADLLRELRGEEPVGGTPPEEPATARARMGDPSPEPATDPSPAPPTDPSPAPTEQDGPPKRPSLLITGVVFLGLAAAVALPLVLATGADDEPATSTAERTEPERTAPERTEPQRTAEEPRTSTAREPRASVPGPVAPLRPVAGGEATGSARLADGGRRLRVSVRGLPEPGERHALWLYSSLSRARRLSEFPGAGYRAELPLPREFRRFRFLDVSVEPDDGNPNHSGQSVLRVPTADLRTSVR